MRAALLACVLLLACSPSSPPAAAQSQSQAQDARFTAPDESGFGRAGELVYLEEVVGDAKPSDALPMVVLIHGRGDRPQRGWLPLRLPRAVRVIMPRAPLPFGDGFSWSRARASDATLASGGALADDLRRMAGQIVEAMRILKRARPTQGVPLVGGFSQGGMLSYAIAALHPSACALAIPISGLLPEALFPARRPEGALPKVRALHGTEDPIVPIKPARNAVRALAKIGYDARLSEQPNIAHTISPAMLESVNGWLSEALAH